MDVINLLVNSGLDKNPPVSLRKMLRITNMAALIIAVSMLPFIALYVFHELYALALSVSTITLFCLLVPVLNYWRCYTLSRLGIIVIANSLCYINSTLVGPDALIFLYELAGLPATVIIFSNRERSYTHISFAFVATLLVLELVLDVKPFTPLTLPQDTVNQIRDMVVPGALLCMLLFVRLFIHEFNKAIRQAEQLTISSEIVRNNLDAVFFTSADGNIIPMNASVSGMYGYRAEEFRHHTINLLGTPYDTSTQIQKALNNVGFWSGEVQQQRKNGEIFTVWLNAFKVENADREVLGTAYTCRDISLQKRTEQALIRAKETAEDAALTKSNFLAAMSHEIRTPLNGVIGITHLLLQDNPKPEHIECLQIQRFAAENLLTLVNDVLDFSRVDAGKVTLELIPFKMMQLLQSIQRSALIAAQEKGLQFRTSIDPELEARFVSDPARLTQILFNLTSNAIKFTHVGYVHLSATLIATDDNRAKIRFAIEDSGIGIPQEKQALIFDQFAQADASITRKYGGSGLGLSITKGLLQEFNSDITVASTPGKGSEFSFELWLPFADDDDVQDDNILPLTMNSPRPAVQITENAAIARVQPTPVNQLHVLVAEDNPVNVMVITRLLEKWGVTVDVASNGQQAVEKLYHRPYDLILMDIQMPIMDGIEASRQVRKDASDTIRNIPILALTASLTEDIRSEIGACGINDYLGKPFQPEQLFEKITHLIAAA